MITLSKEQENPLKISTSPHYHSSFYRVLLSLVVRHFCVSVILNSFIITCVVRHFNCPLLLSLSILSQNFESVKSSEGFIYLVIQFYFPVHRSKTFSHRSGEARADYEDVL
jgi:hypothetical protein